MTFIGKTASQAWATGKQNGRHWERRRRFLNVWDAEPLRIEPFVDLIVSFVKTARGGVRCRCCLSGLRASMPNGHRSRTCGTRASVAGGNRVCDSTRVHVTMLLTKACNTPASFSLSSSESSLNPVPATSNSRRTSSGLTTPVQIPTSRVIMDPLMFSRACWTVRKYDPMVKGLSRAPRVRLLVANVAASLYFISPETTLT